MNGTVVILGKRRPALLAAAALNLPVVLVHDGCVGAISRTLVRGVIPASLDAPLPQWEAVARQLQEHAPLRAIIAASERTVRAAAWLRQRLKVAGSGESQAQLTTDKLAMKTALRAAGIPVADYFAASDTTPIASVLAELGLPLVIKERCGYGGRGTRMYFQREALPAQLAGEELAERLIDGVELSVESFVQDGKLRFVHLTEYFMPRFVSVSPNLLGHATERALLALNRNVIEALAIQTGMTHMEVFVTAQGPVFGEIALRPPGGHIMNLIARTYGFDPWTAWLRTELGESVNLPAAPMCHAAVFLVHPTCPGIVRAVHGWDRACEAPGIVEGGLHLRVGDHVGSREGSGQEVGYLLATAGSRLNALNAILEARRQLSFDIDATE